MLTNCDAACQKIIINSGLMAPAADLLAVAAGPTHFAYSVARVLAAATRATYQAARVAVEQGILQHGPVTSTWKGCAEASKLMEWVDGLSNGEQVPRAAVDTMRKWTADANRRTAALVAGKPFAD